MRNVCSQVPCRPVARGLPYLVSLLQCNAAGRDTGIHVQPARLASALKAGKGHGSADGDKMADSIMAYLPCKAGGIVGNTTTYDAQPVAESAMKCQESIPTDHAAGRSIAHWSSADRGAVTHSLPEDIAMCSRAGQPYARMLADAGQLNKGSEGQDGHVENYAFSAAAWMRPS